MVSEGASTLLAYEEPIELFEETQSSKDLITQRGSYSRRQQFGEIRPLSRMKLLGHFRRLQSANRTLTLEDVEEARPTYRGSPFDDLEELKDDNHKIRDIITHVRCSSALSYAEQLASRLGLLASLAYEETSGLSLDSLRNLLSFLQSHRKLSYPDLVLTPSGNLRAEWRKARNRYFAVEFLSEEECRFVVFAPNPHNCEKPYRISGSTSPEKLLDTVQLYGRLDWIEE